MDGWIDIPFIFIKPFKIFEDTQISYNEGLVTRAQNIRNSVDDMVSSTCSARVPPFSDTFSG